MKVNVLEQNQRYTVNVSPSLSICIFWNLLNFENWYNVNSELPDVQAGFRKGRGTKDQIVNICWIIEKAREFQKKTSISALLTMPKPLTV